MPFGNKAGRCKVYEYGCLASARGEKELVEVILKRNRLWNRLVELDRSFEERFSALIRENAHSAGVSGAEYAALEREVAFLWDWKEAFSDEIKCRRKRARSGAVPVCDLQASSKRVEGCYREKNLQYKQIKKAIRETNQDAFEALEDERREAVKDARRSSGLWWYNWDDVCNDYETARQRVLKDRARGKPASLRFHGFDGSGKAVVRLRERGTAGRWGMPVENVFRANSLFWIEPVSAEAWEHPVRSVRRKAARTVAYFNVGSDARHPAWVVLPMVMHRPLPPDGVVREASVVRRRVGRRFRYTLTVTVEIPDAKAAPRGDGVVAVDLGWRKMREESDRTPGPGEVRACYWADDRGGCGEFRLPERMVDNFLQLRRLRSVRDILFDEAKAVLARFLETPGIPRWLREEAAGVGRWRSQARMVRLLRRWEQERFPGDSVFEWLWEWKQQEDHLYDWESNLREQVLRWRREEYRKFAKRLVGDYGAVVLEDFDLRGVAQKPRPEEGPRTVLPADYQRFIVAPSELRRWIVNACDREGVGVFRVSAKLTTLRCHVCGRREDFDAARELRHECVKFGTTWDQDYNACVNMLTSFFKGEFKELVAPGG